MFIYPFWMNSFNFVWYLLGYGLYILPSNAYIVSLNMQIFLKGKLGIYNPSQGTHTANLKES